MNRMTAEQVKAAQADVLDYARAIGLTPEQVIAGAKAYTGAFSPASGLLRFSWPHFTSVEARSIVDRLEKSGVKFYHGTDGAVLFNVRTSDGSITASVEAILLG